LKKLMNKNFLLEIGTEELPTDSLDILESQLKTKLENKLRDARLAFEELSLTTTPRRAVLFIKGLSDRQESQTAEWVGPAWDRAYDASGKPTEALEGFLRSKKLKETDITKKTTPRGNYAAASMTVEGKSTQEVLPPLLVELFRTFSFPKTMRWDNSHFSFPRPIRWILSLLGSKVLSLSIGQVRSGRFTYGHRFLCPKKIIVKEANNLIFRKILRKAHVVLALEERKKMIRKQFSARAGETPSDEGLVSITSQLVEEPFLIHGKFHSDFLKLPAQILATSMKRHQKIFAVYDKQGRLKPEFLAVINGRRKNLAKISRDYQAVLEAKLRDAQFFYLEDTKEPLEKRVSRLKDIIFLGKLGNVHEKVQRLVQLSDWLANVMKFSGDEKRNLRRAALLCKADLLTQMVYEFPELQGIMGGEYAKVNGEPREVCQGIQEHYLPYSLTQSYQDLAKEQSRLGSFLAILEKIDTLVGAFGVGLEPTGSQDPYALRRAGGGIVKIIRAFNHRLDLQGLIKENIRLYGSSRLSMKESEILASLGGFLKERIAFEIGVRAGSREDQILKAVMKTSWSDIAGVFLRFKVLMTVYDKDRNEFQKAHKVIERTHNILKGASTIQPEIRKELLQDPLERKLYELVEEKKLQFNQLADEEKFDAATRLYAEIFYGPLHEFFDKVLVNVEDASLRENRRALMKAINRLYVDRVADLSVVSQSG